MSEYTPKTDYVRYCYQRGSDGAFEDLAFEFDRWLASVKAEAWDEGQDAYGSMSNPYREESK